MQLEFKLEVARVRCCRSRIAWGFTSTGVGVLSSSRTIEDCSVREVFAIGTTVGASAFLCVDYGNF